MPLNRYTFIWGSVNGYVTLPEMEDSHVLNLIGFLKEREELGLISHEQNKPIVDLLNEEIKIRGLDFFYTLKRLELMPWQCQYRNRDGDKVKWDWKKGIVKV